MSDVAIPFRWPERRWGKWITSTTEAFRKRIILNFQLSYLKNKHEDQSMTLGNFLSRDTAKTCVHFY